MKKAAALIFACILLCSVSCKSYRINNLRFDGELNAKSVLIVRFDSPEKIDSAEYSWYISSSPDGKWEKLPGIWSDEIVLLTSYAGKFLKCEVTVIHDQKKHTASLISPAPVVLNGNPDTDWFRDAGFGIMVHYLNSIMAPGGSSGEWNEAVNSFDAANFASQANDARVGFVMLTLGQNSGYYCSPNATFDSIVGVRPGELCSERDLPMDLIKELGKYNIPLILYLPSNPPISNRLVSEKFRYSFNRDSATSQFNQPLLEKMISEWSLRYGDGVRGWWFDGLYDWNGIKSTRMDMSLKYNISTHTLAAKAGNRHSIVTYNYGFGKIHVNTPYCDYSSGEKQTIDEFPSSRWVEDGVQWFLFTFLGEKWGGSGQQFKTEDLVDKACRIVENEGVLCLEVVTDAKGNILPHHLEQIKAVGQSVREIRENI